MSDVIERIRELLVAESLDAIDFAADIDEKYQRVKNILGRRQRLPADVVTKIVEHYGVDANWLLTGTGRMYRVPPELLEEKMRATPKNNKKSKEASALSPRDKAWLELAQHLPDDQRTRLQEIGDALVSATHCCEKKDAG